MSIMKTLHEWMEQHPEYKSPVIIASDPPPIPVIPAYEEDRIEIAGRPFVRGHLTGRCANGAERDSGTLRHLLSIGPHGHSWSALCGASPGRRSAGWNTFKVEGDWAKDCARCAKKAERLEAKGAVYFHDQS